MKYKLLKKLHPSQVEEVGHVFEDSEDYDFYYDVNDKAIYVTPHEIALLVDAGYLKKECKHCFTSGPHINGTVCMICGEQQDKTELIKKDTYEWADEVINKTKKQFNPTLDLWTTAPPKKTTYWVCRDGGYTANFEWKNNSEDKFRLKTNNCHKTKQSAEEALKRLMS